jgi:hypothetical protein
MYAMGKKGSVEQERRERDLIRESVRLRGASPEKLTKALDNLNEYVVKSTVISIKSKNPGISDERLSQELRKAFA